MNRPIPSFLAAATLLVWAGCSRTSNDTAPTPVHHPVGVFVDDYGIEYVVTDSSWHQQPGGRYRIEQGTDDARMLILHQPATDSTADRWTRLDWMTFDGMEPWTWGFCYTAWDLASPEAAQAAEPADASSPMNGCGGFPFSRMQPVP